MVDGHFLLHATTRQILAACGGGVHFRSTGILGKTAKWWLIGLLVGAAVYTLAGFLIAPRAVKFWIESPNLSGPACRLRVQEVYVNPFTMFLSLRDVTLLDQENKLFVAVGSAETKAWTIEMFREGKVGRDVAIRSLVVTGAEGGETVLAASRVSIRSVMVGSGGAFIDSTYARLERPDVSITHDADGFRYRPAWLSAPGDGQAGACISLDGVEALGGRLRVTDNGVTPSAQLELRDVVAEARRKPGRGAAAIEIDLEGRVDAEGTVSVKARLDQLTGGHPARFSMTVRNVNLPPLSPYFRRMFGRDVVAGVGTATLQQERMSSSIRFDNQLRVNGLRLGETPADTTDEKPVLELALALATDAAGRGEFSMQGSATDSQEQSVVSVFTDGLGRQLDNLAARPFDVLAELAGEPNAVLDNIAFLPGTAEMAPEAQDMLALLANALGQRPLLDLHVRPAYGPTADRDAIAAQQIKLHIALATSKSAREGGNAADPDFDDRRVRDILDEFAGARLTEAKRRAVTRNIGDRATMYRAIYLALVANESVSETLLRRLARFRARSAIDALEREGVERTRFRIADALDTVATNGSTVSLKVEVEARLAADEGDAQDGRAGGDGN